MNFNEMATYLEKYILYKSIQDEVERYGLHSLNIWIHEKKYITKENFGAVYFSGKCYETFME